MKTAAVIFFLFLCFHLLSGNAPAHASSFPPLATFSTVKAQQAGNENAVHDYILTENSGVSEENGFLAAVDDDDEDQFTRRQPLLARSILAFSYAFILYRDSVIAAPPSFYKHLFHTGSPKYIVQRTLRI